MRILVRKADITQSLSVTTHSIETRKNVVTDFSLSDLTGLSWALLL